MAPGELMYCFRLGFFMYWQRHGFCSVNLEQHAADGGWLDMIAGAHAASCTGLHVTASVVPTIAAMKTTAIRAGTTTLLATMMIEQCKQMIN